MSEAMRGFSGFPDGQQSSITVPSLFFSELLPHIDHLVELKVTLYCIYVLQVQEADYPHVRFSEVSKDSLFMNGLNVPAYSDPLTVLRDGFERAVARGSLLHVKVQLSGSEDDLFFLNSQKGRRAVEALQAGKWSPSEEERPLSIAVQRPSLFAYYEQHIGALTPLIVDDLRALQREYSPEKLREAIKLAAQNHVASINYIKKILKRWGQEERPPSASQQAEQDYLKQFQEKYKLEE